MMLPLLLLVFAFVVWRALNGLKLRLQIPGEPRPSQRVRLNIVGAVTLFGLALHLWAWLQIRPQVPVSAEPTTVVYGGPGDGLWLMLMVALPWMVMQLVNVGLATFAARSVKQAVLLGIVLIAAWLGAALLGAKLTQCPSGMTCVGG